MHSLNKIITTISLIAACALAFTTARAVGPSLDGGYPNGNTAEGDDDPLLNLTADTGNTATAGAGVRVGSVWANQFSNEPGTLTFTDVSVQAGFFGNNSSWAAAWGDYDNDGSVDVMTLRHVQSLTNSISQLWHNNAVD